jgi:hypothetical protein
MVFKKEEREFSTFFFEPKVDGEKVKMNLAKRKHRRERIVSITKDRGMSTFGAT